MVPNRYRAVLPAMLMAACVLGRPGVGLAAEMTAGLDRDTIYLGTQTLLQVELTDAPGDAPPAVAPVDGLTISPYGPPGTIQDLFSGSVRRAYRFLITPTRAGAFEIPAVTWGQGTDALRRGPFTLHVREAPLKFRSARIDPAQILPGETATLLVAYQGVARGEDLVVPSIPGLDLRSVGSPRVEVSPSEGMPVSVYQVEVIARENGTYQIDGIRLAGEKADPVTLQVAPFVIVDAQVAEPSLTVGRQTLVHIVARGLAVTEDLGLVLPGGLTAERSTQQFEGPAGTTVFSFNVTAREPGSPTIREVRLADGRRAALPRPVVLSVQQSGRGDILACRAAARSGETLVGEPFLVDYEVFFRGQYQAAGIDVSQAEFANRPDVNIEPVQDPSYEGWSGQALSVPFGQRGRVTVLSGSGDLDGRREQLLRFALRVTPLAAGELDLKGVRIVVRLTIRQERRSGSVFYSSTQSRDFTRTIDAPAHRVIDPPDKTAPPGYRGLVGTALSFSTSLDRTAAAAMSPLTLTMKISGQGVGSRVQPPPLAEIRELDRDFEISPTAGGGDVRDRTITFTQVIRPRSPSVRELPALPLVYYDYAKKEYETVYSLPIPIAVTPGGVVGASAMQASATRPPDPASADGPDNGDVAGLGANFATLGTVQAAPPLGPIGVLTVLLGGPAAIGGAWAGRAWYRRRRPQASRRHRQRELIRQLDAAVGRADFHARLAGLVQAYLRVTFELPSGELSADMLLREMSRHGVEEGFRHQIEQVLAVCDGGRFAGRQADGLEQERLVEQARSALAAVDRR